MKESGLYTSSPKGIGWRHIQVLLLFLGITIAYALRGCMSVAIVAMRNCTSNPDFPQYDWNQSQSTTILGSFFYGYVIAQLPAGHFARTGSASKLMAGGMISNSLVIMLMPWLATFGYFAVTCGRILQGICQGCLVPCMYTIVSRWVPPLERARFGTFIVNGLALGTILGMSVSGVLAGSKFGWPSIFYFFGFCGIVWSVIFYFLNTDYPSEHLKIGLKEVQYINTSLNKLNDSENDKVSKMPWKHILKSVPLWALIIASCGNIWGYYTFLIQLPTYMKYILHYDITESGLISGLPYIAMWLMGFPIGYLADYALLKGASITSVRKTCAIIGLWTPALCMVVLALMKTVDKTIVVGILVIAIGFNSGGSSSTQINHIDLSPNFAGPVVSYINMIGNFVGIGVPIFCKLILKDETNQSQWEIIFFITAGVYFFSNLIFVIFGKGDVQPWNDPDKNFKNSRSQVT